MPDFVFADRGLTQLPDIPHLRERPITAARRVLAYPARVALALNSGSFTPGR